MTERQTQALDDIMATSNRTPLRSEQRSTLVEENGTQACWKLSWSLVSFAWLNKELRHWTSVCLPAFVCMVRCQYRNSSVSEKSEGSMEGRGERNWITVTLSWPFITVTHTMSPVPQMHTCSSLRYTCTHTNDLSPPRFIVTLVFLSCFFLSPFHISFLQLGYCADVHAV